MKVEGQTVTAEDYVKKVELTGENNAFVISPSPATNGIMRLTDGVLTGTTAAGALTLTAQSDKQGRVATWSATDDGTADFTTITFPQAYGLVAPVTGKMGVKITLGSAGNLDADKDHTYQTVDNTTITVNWEQGKHHAYTMTVTDRGIEFSQVQVVGWDEAPPKVDVPVV